MYLRISRDKGENVDTLQNHRERLTKFCEDRGYTFTIYEEIISGQADLKDRKVINKLLDELPNYDAVIVVGTDRLSRDLEFSIHIWKRFQKADIPLITPERIYTENDFMNFAVESLMAHQEYSQIKKRMQEGKRIRASRGEYVGSRQPLGYSQKVINHRRTLVPNEDAEKVRQVFNLSINGHGAIQISEVTGIPARSIRHMLNNQQYIGTMIYNDIIVPNAFEPIVDEDTFKKAQDAMKGRFVGDREVRSRTKGTVRTILKDLVYCDDCGRKTLFQLKRREYNDKLVVKKCECGMRGAKEEVMLEEFYQQFEFVEQHFKKEWQKALDTPVEDNRQLLEGQLQELNKKAEKLNKRLRGYKEMRADGELTKVEYEEVRVETEAELTKLQESIRNLDRQLRQLDKETVIKGYWEKIQIIRDIKQTDDKTEANRLLKLIVDKIYYRRSDSKIVGTEADGSPMIDSDVIEMQVTPK